MNVSNPFFEVCGYKVISERMHETTSRSQAIVEVRFGHDCVRRSATGVGLVHALDRALRSCLEGQFPELESVRLADYRVAVVDASDGTGARARVLKETKGGCPSGAGGCVSTKTPHESWETLGPTAVMGVMKVR